MIYILDFDGVIFDDQRFKSDFRHVFSCHGITHRIYEQTYRQAKEARKGRYEVNTHISILKAMYPDLDMKNLDRDLFAAAKRSSKYIFADAKSFIRSAQKRGDALFLLTMGDKLFQEIKVNASGTTAFFTDVFITESLSKIPLLARIKKQARRGDIIFIDDKKEVVDEIKKHYRHITVIQMIRNVHISRSTLADSRIKDFSDIMPE